MKRWAPWICAAGLLAAPACTEETPRHAGSNARDVLLPNAGTAATAPSTAPGASRPQMVAASKPASLVSFSKRSNPYDSAVMTPSPLEQWTAPAGAAQVATINGHGIDAGTFRKMLVAAIGKRTIIRTVRLIVVQDACRLAGLDLSGDRFKQSMLDEYAASLRHRFGADVDKETADKWFSQELQTAGLSALEFRMELETAADLHRLQDLPAQGVPLTVQDKQRLDQLLSQAVIAINDPDVVDALRADAPDDESVPFAFTEIKPGSEPDAKKSPLTINGRDINTQAFNDTLMHVGWLRIFQPVMDIELMRQASAAANLQTEGLGFESRVQAEYRRLLNGITSAHDEPERINGMADALRQRGMSPLEFRLGLVLRAGMRALAESKITVMDSDIAEAYTAVYGERRRLMLMPVNNAVDAEKLRQRISILKETPAQATEALHMPVPVAWTLSSNAAGFETLVKAVWDLREGELSAITNVTVTEGQPPRQIVAFLERILPDLRPTTPLASVQDELRQKVRDQKESAWSTTRLQTLRKEAAVAITDPILKQELDSTAAAMKKQSSATTAPR